MSESDQAFNASECTRIVYNPQSKLFEVYLLATAQTAEVLVARYGTLAEAIRRTEAFRRQFGK